MEAPIRRISLEVVYGGTSYCGRQAQPRGVSVQSELERTLSMLFRQPISVMGVGRTDVGVHAYGMMVYVDPLIPYPPLVQIQRDLYDILRGGISIRFATPVILIAHVRFDATSRRYHYYALTCSNPFRGDYCWERRTLPDIELMSEAYRHLIDEHDLTSFSELHTQVRHNRHTIYAAHWEQVEMPGLWDVVRYEVCVNRFLRGMVRMMVGMLLEVGYRRCTPDSIAELIQREDRTLVGSAALVRAFFSVETTYPDSVYSLDPQ